MINKTETLPQRKTGIRDGKDSHSKYGHFTFCKEVCIIFCQFADLQEYDFKKNTIY